LINPKDPFRLDGKVAVVSGGFGLLGQQFSSALAAQGAAVFVLDLLAAPAKMIPSFEQSWNGKKIRSIRANVTSREEMEKALQQIEGLAAVPEILVNNAAIDSPPDAPPENNGPFEDYSCETLDKVWDVNIKGTLIPCQVFGGAMARGAGGSIINISSIYGVLSPQQEIYAYKEKDLGAPWYKPVAYSITKGGILNLTRYLATYWAKKGVRVNTLTPAGIFNNQDSSFLQKYQSRIPVGRMARPDEMNGAVVFMASDASTYMTGANLVVDGGWTAW